MRTFQRSDSHNQKLLGKMKAKVQIATDLILYYEGFWGIPICMGTSNNKQPLICPMQIDGLKLL